MPPIHDQRLNLAVSEALLDRIDDWRRLQKAIPSRSEAARALIERTLDRELPASAEPRPKPR